MLGYSFEDEPVLLDDFLWACEDTRELLALKTTTGVVASCLLGQLAASACRLPCLPYEPSILVDTREVCDQIGKLERTEECRPLPTKAEERFGPGPFEGLWHKHWTQAPWLPRNIALEFDKFGIRDVMVALRSHFGPTVRNGVPTSGQSLNLIANAAVIDTYISRVKRRELTGEWIVFAKLQSGNVYLTLATHAEAKADANAIVSRCKQAASEFPELAGIVCLR